jgi:hypothetical protein
MTIQPRDVGKYGRVHTAQGNVVAEGRIVSHSLVPSVCIEQADGTQVHWRHDMCDVVDPPPAPERRVVTDCYVAGKACTHDPDRPCDPYALIPEGEEKPLGWLFNRGRGSDG